MTSIIFGVSGQDGQYLSFILESAGHLVIGVSRSDGNWTKGDISNYELVRNIIVYYQPDFIFHLAANSSTQHGALFENHASIATGTLNILENVKSYSPKTKVFISGSALQFKNLGLPVKETDEFDPKDGYSVQRVYSTYLSRYFRSIGLRVYVGYFFHHDSPLRPHRHLNMKIAKAALAIKNGSEEILEIGNLDIIKEFNYAEDMMHAVWTLVSQDIIFETVIGSGKGYSIKEWVKICFEKVGLDWQNHVKINENYQPEFLSLISSPLTLYSLGWTPTTDILGLAELLLEE